MKKLTTILEKIKLSEALPLSKAKELASIKRNPNIQERLDSIFIKLKNSTKTQTSKRGDRIYIPYKSEETNTFKYSEDIITYLQSKGYTIKDYKLGICTDKYNRELKIGKVLSKLNNQDLLNKFNTDKGRESKNNISSFMVFSKHPYDIGGSSTDRGWTSCMNLFTGGNKHYILDDIKEGTFIVYLITSNDMNIQKPIARILVKPYVNMNDENDVLYSPTQKIYGTAPTNFLVSVNKILEKIQGDQIGIFNFVDTLYKDSDYDKDSITNIKMPKTKQEVEDICKHVFFNDNYTVNEDLTIDIDGDVRSNKMNNLIQNGRFVVKFGKISGFFFCYSKRLTTLEGGPIEVGEQFDCSINRLTTLKGAPKKVGGDFDCRHNFSEFSEEDVKTVSDVGGQIHV